jgi:hypothetical protein
MTPQGARNDIIIMIVLDSGFWLDKYPTVFEISRHSSGKAIELAEPYFQVLIAPSEIAG